MDTEQIETASTVITQLAERNGGIITPQIVLDSSRPKNAPLHPHFCWNNSKAAEEYRLIQAAGLIRSIKVTYTKPDETTVRIRAWSHVKPEDDGEETEVTGRGVYVATETAMGVESYRDQILAQCKRDAAAFVAKYKCLTEAAKIIEAMENLQ